MRPIYLLAIALAVFSLTMIPMLSEDSDAAPETYDLNFYVQGEFYCKTGQYGPLPDDPVIEGYEFKGWMFENDIIDPLTFEFPDPAPYGFYGFNLFAALEPISNPDPEPTDLYPYAYVLAVVLVIIGFATVYLLTKAR